MYVLTKENTRFMYFVTFREKIEATLGTLIPDPRSNLNLTLTLTLVGLILGSKNCLLSLR